MVTGFYCIVFGFCMIWGILQIKKDVACVSFFWEEACTHDKKITKYSNIGSFYLPLASKASQVLNLRQCCGQVWFFTTKSCISFLISRWRYIFSSPFFIISWFFFSLVFSPFILHCWPFHSPSFCDVLQDKYFWNYSNSNIMLLLNIILHIYSEHSIWQNFSSRGTQELVAT